LGRREVTLALLRAGCLKRGRFKLSSGRISDVYVDIRRLYSYPYELRIVVEEMSEVARELGCDMVAGIETSGIPLASLIAFLLGKPMVYVRKSLKGHGTMRLVEGVVEEGAKVLVVDDVATTGSSILRAVRVLRHLGVSVERALVVVDRGEGAAEALGKEGVELHSLVSLDEILGVGEHA